MQVGGYSSGISTTGGIAPLNYAIDSGSLPAGLTLDATTGLISGTIPSSAANTAFAIVVKVSDATGQTASKTYTGTVAPGSSLLTIHTTTLSQITSGIAFSYALAVTGGSMPRTYSVSSGGLPAGLALNSSSGLISGTPTAGTAGQAYAFTITCTDADNQNASKTYTGTVASSSTSSLGIVTTTIPSPSAGSSYLAAIGVTGGTAPYTYAVSAGALPSGLSINSTSGLISGSVAHAAKGSSYLFTITVTDAASLSASQIYSGFVGTYTTAIVPAALVAATPGASYSASLASVGGEAPYTYTITSGALPSGLSLNSSTGLIAGVVSEAEAGNTKNFTIRSVDANNVQVSVSYALTVNAFAVVVSTATLQDAIESAMYSNGGVAVAASGGTGPYSFEYSGALPGGIGLSSSGSFFGVPDLASGSLPSGTVYTIHVRARDSLNQVSAQKTLTLKVTINSPVVSVGTPTNAVLGSSYHYSFAATGGRPPYVFAVAAGSLPSGLSLNAIGAVSGAATATSPRLSSPGPKGISAARRLSHA